MTIFICQTCRKSRDQLIKENKLSSVDGYEQCADCGSDLEYDSVVLRDDILKNARKEAAANNDYVEVESHIRPGTTYPVLNSHKYWPDWYREEQAKKHKEICEDFS